MFKNLSAEALGISGRPSELIELAMSHGFKGLDLDLADFAEQVQTQGYDRASRLLVSARLKIGSFRLPVRWHDDTPEHRDDLAMLAERAGLAAKLGCTRAVTLVEPEHDSRRYHENFEYHRRALAAIADVLASLKMRLGLAFLAPHACRVGRAFQFIQTFDELVLLVRNIGAPNIGIAFDSWHWHLGGGTPEALAALSADQVVTVSLADASPDTTAANAQLASRRFPLDGGAIDNAAVLATLATARYDGPVTPAPDCSQFAGTGRDAIVKQVAAALDQTLKAAGVATTGKFAAAQR